LSHEINVVAFDQKDIIKEQRWVPATKAVPRQNAKVFTLEEA